MADRPVTGLTDAERRRIGDALILSHPSAVHLNVRAAVESIVAVRDREAREERDREWAREVEALAGTALDHPRCLRINCADCVKRDLARALVARMGGEDRG